MSDDRLYRVMVNGAGGVTMWPANLANPRSWSQIGRDCARQEAIEQINALLTPGEVATALAGIPEVARARAVTGRPLVEIEVSGSYADRLQNDTVEAWEAVFTNLYDEATSPTVGWVDSTTGRAFPDATMADWVDAARKRVETLPRRTVLEIGSGSGLIVEAILALGETHKYIATDLVDVDTDIQPNVMLDERVRQHLSPAHEVADIVEDDVDLAVLHSVIQYFPSTRYLTDVLRGLASRVRPGGHIYIGDVWHAAYDPSDTTAGYFRPEPVTKCPSYMQEVHRGKATRDELSFLPGWFDALPASIPGITRCDAVPRLGSIGSELTRFRFDVLLHVGCEPGVNTAPSEFISVKRSDIETLASGGPARWIIPNGWFDSVSLTPDEIHELAEGRVQMRLVDDNARAVLDLARLPGAPSCHWGPARRHAPYVTSRALPPRTHADVVTRLLDRANLAGDTAVEIVVTDLEGAR